MDDRTAVATATVSAAQQSAYRGGDKLRTQFPTIDYLRRRASRRIPALRLRVLRRRRRRPTAASGATGRGSTRSRLVPRYGVMPALPPVEVELFGRKYAAPLGIPPMGGPAIVWPGADAYMAQAAQRAGVPYTLGTVGGITIEQAAEIAPDVLWFQLYRMARNDHWLGFELMRRCEAAGVHVLVHDGRRAGTHRAAARGRRRARRQQVLAGTAHDLRDAALARLADVAAGSMVIRASPTSRTMPARTRASTR